MVGPAFSLKLVGPWTVLGKKNESGRTRHGPRLSEQSSGTGVRLARCQRGSRQRDSVTADASTRVTADARAAETRKLRLPKLFLSLCPVSSFRLSFPLPTSRHGEKPAAFGR